MKDILFFLPLFKPYKIWLLAGIILAAITSIASISLLTLSGWFISASAIAGIAAPDGVAFTFNFLLPAAEIRALAIIRTLGRYAERVVTHEATFRVLAEIRCWFFAKLIPLAPGRLAMLRSTELLTGITQDIDALDGIYLRLLTPLLIAFFTGSLAVLFIANYSVLVSVFVFMMLLISAVLIPWIFNRLGGQGAKDIVSQYSQFKTNQVELLQGLAEISAFNAYARYKQQLMAVSEKILATQRHNNHLNALSSSVTALLSQITLLITMVIAATLFAQGEMTGAVLVMICFVVMAVFEIITPLPLALQMMAKIQSSAAKIKAIAELPSTILEPATPQSITNSKANITLNAVSFKYSEQSDWVLNNIHLKIQPGDKIAIIGDSGAGKSTLLQLIMRFFDPQQGVIEYADIDYKQFNSNDLLKQFSILSQHTQLFSGTIKDNLLIGNITASDREIQQAIKLAGLSQMIKQLPLGIDTWIGENGANVSGGEARRIALARVYLKNTPVLILDEPTEGLDSTTENEVLDALDKIAKDKTLIMVTHRLASLRLVDHVYQLRNGKLKENLLSE